MNGDKQAKATTNEFGWRDERALAAFSVLREISCMIARAVEGERRRFGGKEAYRITSARSLLVCKRRESLSPLAQLVGGDHNCDGPSSSMQLSSRLVGSICGTQARTVLLVNSEILAAVMSFVLGKSED